MPAMELAQSTLFLPLFLCVLFLITQEKVLVSAEHPTKLFVFGDSFADTGNTNKSLPPGAPNSWIYPYGITFPGKPTGRFSDGLLLIDFIAEFIGVKSPPPYRPYILRKEGVNDLKFGMNFAYGGTGVFDTYTTDPNMTVQINEFQKLIKKSVFTAKDLNSSAAFFFLSGNDYAFYLSNNKSLSSIPTFMTNVVNQLTFNLKRVYDLGVKKIVVTSLTPMGCLPGNTVRSLFQTCIEEVNQLVGHHNLLLQQGVAKLNTETKKSLMILDLYASFRSVLQNKGDHQGNIEFKNLLKPCCVGTSNTTRCGSVDAKGVKMYTVCEDPESAFFWDDIHPSQQGWRAVYSALEDSLKHLQ